MIYHPIQKMVDAGIKEIMIVTGKEHMGDVVSLLGSGGEFGAEFTYRVQDEAGGIAQALYLAKNFAAGSRIAVILGDNIFEKGINSALDKFLKQEQGAHLILKEVHDPQRYGVAELSNSKIVSIEEKPNQPKSNAAVTGIYLFDHQVFDFIDRCAPSQRGELEITDVNNHYIQAGQCEYSILDGWWTDAGTFDSLRTANSFFQ